MEEDWKSEQRPEYDQFQFESSILGYHVLPKIGKINELCHNWKKKLT